jgi:regulatory protein YycI of two-component signal transduction system YycFG
MDWSKIKTIFIITFLVLDVYLLYQFLKIRDANKYEIMSDASFEEKLKAAEITFGELPKTLIKAKYLGATPKVFTAEDTKKLTGQRIASKEPSTVLIANLEKPLQLSSKFEPAELTAFLKGHVLYGDQYQFWEKNDKQQTITYFQQYDNLPLYHNINGMISFKFNVKNQVVAYQQSYLEGIEGMAAKKEEILSPLKVIETLHQKGLLKPKSKITKVELGYSTLIQLAASQVLAPTWRFEVNGKESLFVNAFEGQIIDFNSDEKMSVE